MGEAHVLKPNGLGILKRIFLSLLWTLEFATNLAGWKSVRTLCMTFSSDLNGRDPSELRGQILPFPPLVNHALITAMPRCNCIPVCCQGFEFDITC